jgi:hypothetical protein
MNNSKAHLRFTGSACPNKAQLYLFTLAPAGADLMLLIAIEVALWIV